MVKRNETLIYFQVKVLHSPHLIQKTKNQVTCTHAVYTYNNLQCGKLQSPNLGHDKYVVAHTGYIDITITCVIITTLIIIILHFVKMQGYFSSHLMSLQSFIFIILFFKRILMNLSLENYEKYYIHTWLPHRKVQHENTTFLANPRKKTIQDKGFCGIVLFG